jgi:hypothetical protein
VINAGGHEYVVFPASGDALLKKITAARQSSGSSDRSCSTGPGSPAVTCNSA